jgi:hypothetical protein
MITWSFTPRAFTIRPIDYGSSAPNRFTIVFNNGLNPVRQIAESIQHLINIAQKREETKLKC